MVDALTEESDEGRGLAAKSIGELPNKLRSGDVRMGKPCRVNLGNHALVHEAYLGK